MGFRGYKLESTNPEMAGVIIEALELWLKQAPEGHPLAEEARTHINLARAAILIDEASKKE